MTIERGRARDKRERGRTEEGLSFYTSSFDALGRERRKHEKKKKCGNKAEKGTNERIVRMGRRTDVQQAAESGARWL